MALAPQTQAPDFTLSGHDGQSHSLSAEVGNWVLLYFYPKDDTPGCTQQACDIRDNWQAFEEAGVTVFGISADSVESHAAFVEKYQLPFVVLSDPEKEVIQLYDVWQQKSMFGKKYMGIERTSYLINPEGIIHAVYPKVSPAKHADLVLRDMQTVQ